MNTLKEIRNMYTTETFRSRPAFAKYGKIPKVLNKKIKSSNMVAMDPH